MDFEKFSETAEKPKQGLELMQDLMSEADMLDAQLKELEEQVASVLSRYNFIKTKLLPDAMSQAQTSEWKNAAGSKVKIESFVSGSLPKEPDKLAAAIKWLEDHEAGGLIRSELAVEFSKSQHNEALAMVDDIKKQGLPATLTSTVHAQTLQAFGREKLKAGEEIDFEVLGLYSGRTAKITHAKAKKK